MHILHPVFRTDNREIHSAWSRDYSFTSLALIDGGLPVDPHLLRVISHHGQCVKILAAAVTCPTSTTVLPKLPSPRSLGYCKGLSWWRHDISELILKYFERCGKKIVKVRTIGSIILARLNFVCIILNVNINCYIINCAEFRILRK